jgi:hypothetical protein
MSVPANNVTPLPTAKAAPTLAELLEQRATLCADIEYIADQVEQIDAQLIARLDTVGTHDVDGVKVQIREYSRTDLKRLAADYPAEQFPQLYELTVSADAVKREFAPTVLDGYKVTGKRSVVIR